MGAAASSEELRWDPSDSSSAAPWRGWQRTNYRKLANVARNVNRIERSYKMRRRNRSRQNRVLSLDSSRYPAFFNIQTFMKIKKNITKREIFSKPKFLGY